MIPFTRPSIGEAEIEAVTEVLRSGWITTGPRVQELEATLADHLGGGVQVRLFNSGTSALEAALLAHEVGPGDEVIVPAMSFVATANVVLRVGARPVFVDVDLVSRNLDAERVAAALTPRTRAVIPVHFAGRPVEMDPIYRLGRERNLLILEDAAQAIGSRQGGRPVGASGNPVCFSFHPNKNITTVEGGALACADPHVVKRVERIRFHGIERDAEGLITVPEWGGKMNLPDVGAALGLVQLTRLEDFNERRRELAQRYLQRLPDHPALLLPEEAEGHSWHMFCVCLDAGALGMERPQVIDWFRRREIGLGVHYPAMHLFPLYRRFGYGEGDFPNAERIGRQTLTLPLFPALTDAEHQQVCDAFHELLENGA